MATDTLPHAAGIIGAAVPRIDGPLKTTGTARYAVDHDFPGLVHAVPVQSTIASGRIRTLDASAAEKMPGVLLVFHHRNMEKVYRLFPHQDDATTSEARPPFEDETIYYWGQYVAAVVAETLEQARAAANAVREVANFANALAGARVLISVRTVNAISTHAPAKAVTPIQK